MNPYTFFRSFRVFLHYRRRFTESLILDVRQQYIGSVLGTFWAFLFPLFQLTIYAGLYAVIFKVRPSGLTEWEYVLLVFSGLVPLLTFNSILTSAASSLYSNKSLLLNTVFPAELIPLRSALTAHVPGLASLGFTLLLGFFLGRSDWKAVLLVPFFWALLVMFAVGLGWILSLLTIVARDVQHVLGLALMLMTVLSPFAYTPEMVPRTLKFIIYFNPLSYFVLSFQQVITYGTWPELVPTLGSVIFGVGFFTFGYTIFAKTKYVFFDHA